MRTRRHFFRTAVAAPVLAALSGRLRAADGPMVSQRPPAAQRKFTSDAVEAKLQEVKKAITDPQLSWLFENCYPNPLDSSVTVSEVDGQPDTVIVADDTGAMWLRDSAAQVMPYLPLVKSDKKLLSMITGVIKRQSRCIVLDPYGSAFSLTSAPTPWAKDMTVMKAGVFERKWAVDSLCWAIRLSHGLWKVTGDASLFDKPWQDATAAIVRTFRDQQRIYNRGGYTFQRVSPNPSDTLAGGGYGSPTRPCGLIHSGFRPSGDACTYPLLIPSNLFAATSLDQLGEIYGTELNNQPFANECQNFAEEIRTAVNTHGKARHVRHGEIYAYEVDGFGEQTMMDDANIPSLLALPYLGSVKAEDPLYQRTRAHVLSDDNPYFFRGSAGEGLGAARAGLGMIWPVGVITRALTSTNDKEIAGCLTILKASTAGTGFMHESFSRNDAARFTGKWYPAANALFGDLIVRLYGTKPALLKG